MYYICTYSNGIMLISVLALFSQNLCSRREAFYLGFYKVQHYICYKIQNNYKIVYYIKEKKND